MAPPYRPSARKRSTAAIRIQHAWRRRRKYKKYSSSKYSHLGGKYNRAQGGGIYSFKRVELTTAETVVTNPLVSVNPGFIGAAYSFQLSDVSDAATFPLLFDQYKLAGVSLQVLPYVNTYNAPSIQPQVIMSTDFDDANVPDSAEKMLNRKGTDLKPFSRRVTRYIKPKILSNIYKTALTNSYKPTTGFLDLTNPLGTSGDVPHYGIKLGFLAAPAQTITYILKRTYFLQFKEPVVR